MLLNWLQILQIVFDNLINTTNDSRIEEIPIQCKALPHTLIIRWQFGSKPIESNLIIVIKVLQYSNNLFDGLNVCITAILNIMEWSSLLIWVSIIDPKDKMQSSSINYVWNEWISTNFPPFVYHNVPNNKAILIHSLRLFVICHYVYHCNLISWTNLLVLFILFGPPLDFDANSCILFPCKFDGWYCQWLKL